MVSNCFWVYFWPIFDLKTIKKPRLTLSKNQFSHGVSHLTNLDVTEMKTEISDKVYAKLKAFYKEKQQKLIIENQTLHENYDCYFNTMNKIRGVAAKILKNFGLILDPSVIENSSVNHNTSFPYFMTPDYSMAMVHSQRQVRRVCLWVG